MATLHQLRYSPTLLGKHHHRFPSPFCTLTHCYHSKKGKQSNCLELRDMFFFLLRLELASLVKSVSKIYLRWVPKNIPTGVIGSHPFYPKRSAFWDRNGR